MIKLDENQLKRLQEIELELLVEVDRICRKCNIEYTLIAGTLLGAVRGAGFIPWDDDADIGMLRSEYEKFRTVCETELNSDKFYFQDNRNTTGYRWGYGKLRRKNTRFVREFQEHMPYEQGVFIDIFPMDGIPDNYFARSIHNFHCFCIRKVLWSEVGKKMEKQWALRIWYNILSNIPVSFVFEHYERLIEKSNKKETLMVRMLLFPSPTKDYGYYRKWYTNVKEMVFENHFFYAMREAEDYLSFTYGNYMELPPEENRKIHPVSKLKLL